MSKSQKSKLTRYLQTEVKKAQADLTGLGFGIYPNLSDSADRWLNNKTSFACVREIQLAYNIADIMNIAIEDIAPGPKST